MLADLPGVARCFLSFSQLCSALFQVGRIESRYDMASSGQVLSASFDKISNRLLRPRISVRLSNTIPHIPSERADRTFSTKMVRARSAPQIFLHLVMTLFYQACRLVSVWRCPRFCCGGREPDLGFYKAVRSSTHGKELVACLWTVL